MRKNRRQHRDLRTEFEARFIRDTETDCWNWTGNTFKRGGYGAFTCRPLDIFMARAHRLAWALYRHPISEETHVLHSCDNRLCVNPDHLFLGDQTTNMEDKIAKGRQDRGETHGMAKLTEEQAIAILSDTRFLHEIAAAYGVSSATVSDIKRARSWPHLDRSNVFRRLPGNYKNTA